MCRLIGYVTRKPVTVNDVLQNTLTALKEISHEHTNGWGFAWYDQDEQLQLVKSPKPAYADEDFDKKSHSIQSSTFIGHLRKATIGLNMCTANTHPFIHDQIAFAHNGTIKPINALEEMIAPHLKAEIHGATDSERYFLALLTAIEQSATPVAGIQNFLSTIFTSFEISGVNCLFSTPDTLYAICAFNPHAARAEHDPDHFLLKYHMTPDAVIIGSTGLGQDSTWEDLLNGHMLIVNRSTLEVTIVDLDYKSRFLQEDLVQPLIHQ